jgi:hypothetical protein
MDSKKKKPLNQKHVRDLEEMAGAIGDVEDRREHARAEANRQYRIHQAESRAGAARIRFWIIVLSAPFILLWFYVQWTTSTRWERSQMERHFLNRIFDAITGKR